MDVPRLPTRSQPEPAATAVIYPSISDWLNYCDSHLACAGEDFMTYTAAFKKLGY